MVGQFPHATEKILLFFLAIAFHVDDDIHGAFLVAVQDAIEKILQIFESVAWSRPIKPACLAGMDALSNKTSGSRLHLLDFKNKSKMTQHQFQSFTSTLQRHPAIIKDCRYAPTLFVRRLNRMPFRPCAH